METTLRSFHGGPCDGAELLIADGNITQTKRRPDGKVAVYVLREDGSYGFDGYWPGWFGELAGPLDEAAGRAT